MRYIDLNNDTHRQIIVDREEGQYLGHVSSVLLEDNKTIVCMYPKGHGRGSIVEKMSYDGGLTWTDRLPLPESFVTSMEVPTIFRCVDKEGKKRIIMFSGLFPIRMSVSEDDGYTWTELAPMGDYGGIVAMGDMIAL
ncbi:MAG: exo-alpha-sialidase, partial [Clostridia bacterium]|nr:exo-alpha-sialidase [Clostridia bacterium]